MDVLEKIFGSSAKVKIMRIFLFNPGVSYDLSSIADRAKVSKSLAGKEIKILQDICLIKQKSFTRTVKGKGKNGTAKKKKVRGWLLNDTFSYLQPLQNFLIKTSLLQDKEIIKKISRIGRIRLLIISGVFIQEWESRVDLLIVGDGLNRTKLESTIKGIEAEVGKELAYAAFETSDFQYRVGMYDKLIRDILDYPHRKIINKIGLN
jgi:hypothetical protein